MGLFTDEYVYHTPKVIWRRGGMQKHGPCIERIGAAGAALRDERSTHKNRAERVHSSPDALWGRWSDSMSKELTEDSSSDTTTTDEPLSSQISRRYQGAGTAITGPDAEDVHVVGGDD